MALNEVLKHIDDEIARLQQARELLAGASSGVAKAPVGRPRGPRKEPAQTQGEGQTRRKRNLSPEGRKAIADAMKKRWAARRSAEQSA